MPKITWNTSKRFIKQIDETYLIERIEYDVWADQINVTSSFQSKDEVFTCARLSLGFFKIQAE